ncbi:hypothetical protein KAI78_03505 [bacterium]|nr:hypothetical protein [bacterium]
MKRLSIFALLIAFVLISLSCTSVLSDEDAVMKTINDSLKATTDEDVDAYMATIHSSAAGLDKVKTMLDKMFEEYDFKYDINEKTFIGIEGDEAKVRLDVTTTKVSGPAFKTNRMVSTVILKKDDGVWKISSSTIEDSKFLE